MYHYIIVELRSSQVRAEVRAPMFRNAVLSNSHLTCFGISVLYGSIYEETCRETVHIASSCAEASATND